MFGTTKNGCRVWMKRVGALLCLVPLLLGQSEVLPGLLAMAAAVEGSHTVHVGTSPGEFKLVLSHERGQVGRSDYNPRHSPSNASHRHGMASRILCTFASRSSPLWPDHVATFERGTTSEKSGSETAPAAKRFPKDVVGLTSFATQPTLSRSVIHQRNAASLSPSILPLASLSTIVLLI
jgi:hypothetical protein